MLSINDHLTIHRDPRYVSIKVPAMEKFIPHAEAVIMELVQPHIDQTSSAQFCVELQIIHHELFSNVLVHARSKTIEIQALLEEEKLQLTMSYTGAQFGLVLHNLPAQFSSMLPDNRMMLPPYMKELVGKSFVLSAGIDGSVICHIRWNDQLEFTFQRGIDDLTTSIPEHYGMSLLTKLSRRVIYTSMSQNRNEFVITKNLSASRNS